MAVQVRSISHAFAILRLLSRNRPSTLSEICQALDLSPSSGLNVLHTLVQEGAVERDSRGKTYNLAAEWRSLTVLNNREAERLGQLILPFMTRLAETENVALGLWQVVPRDRMQLVVHAESKAEMRLRLADAQRQPLGAGAGGRALAAAQQIEGPELERRFRAVRWQSSLSLDEYRGQVGDAVRTGYGVDRGHAHPDVLSVAVATAKPAPGFCLSASMFSASAAEQDIERLASKMAAIWDDALSRT